VTYATASGDCESRTLGDQYLRALSTEE
jgi:hypothetical protein